MGEHSKDFICSTGYKPFETLETLDTSIGDRKEFTQRNEKKKHYHKLLTPFDHAPSDGKLDYFKQFRTGKFYKILFKRNLRVKTQRLIRLMFLNKIFLAVLG